MARIDHFVPSWHVRDVDRVAVAAAPERVLEAFAELDLLELAFVRKLFALWSAPAWVGALAHGERPERRSVRYRDLVGEGSDFLELERVPGRAVVVGAMGSHWKGRITLEPFDPSRFGDVTPEAGGKLALSLEASPRRSGGSYVSFEVRVSASDEVARRAVERYFAVVGRLSHLVRASVLSELVRELGAVDERGLAVPGDDVLDASVVMQHAVTLEAPPSRVWPWLLQMGGDRAGWYSWDILDHAGVKSAESIVPELQALKVGDRIRGTPHSQSSFAVLELDQERSLVLGAVDLGGPDSLVAGATWSFLLDPIGDDATRLIVRVRARPSREAPRLTVPALRIAHEIMERKQLLELRRRVERPLSHAP